MERGASRTTGEPAARLGGATRQRSRAARLRGLATLDWLLTYLLRRHYSLVIASGPEVAFVTPTIPVNRSDVEWFCLRNIRS
ncbi:hypothetical protein Tco_0676362 [Tanacetum coccineum]